MALEAVATQGAAKVTAIEGMAVAAKLSASTAAASAPGAALQSLLAGIKGGRVAGSDAETKALVKALLGAQPLHQTQLLSVFQSRYATAAARLLELLGEM